MITYELRKRIVEAYTSGLSGTYAETAAIFGVGESTVNRLLRLYRDTGDVKAKPVGGNYPRQVDDLDWLLKHAENAPDARLSERIDDWEKFSGRRVASSTMSKAMKAINWSYKKNSRSL